MRALVRIFISWLPLCIAVTGLSLLVYVGVQQSFRQGFNDPSVQMAEDMAARLSHGAQPQSLASGDEIDMRKSIAPFFIVYNESGRVIGGNGVLGEKIPTPPHGVFENIDFWRSGHSWEPEQGVRIAAAIVPYAATSTSGFVLAGRNMRLMEDHIVHTGWLVLEAWLVLIAATFVAKGIARFAN